MVTSISAALLAYNWCAQHQMMKYDMGGAGAVLGAAQALAVLQPPGVEVRPRLTCYF